MVEIVAYVEELGEMPPTVAECIEALVNGMPVHSESSLRLAFDKSSGTTLFSSKLLLYTQNCLLAPAGYSVKSYAKASVSKK